MGSDDLNLRVLSTSSDNEKERKNAGKVLRLLGRGRHWVLVVLLLSNVVSTILTLFKHTEQDISHLFRHIARTSRPEESVG
jgi:hypothetical protein